MAILTHALVVFFGLSIHAVASEVVSRQGISEYLGAHNMTGEPVGLTCILKPHTQARSLQVTIDYSGEMVKSELDVSDRIHPRTRYIIWKAKHLVQAQLSLDMLQAYQLSADRILRPLEEKNISFPAMQALRELNASHDDVNSIIHSYNELPWGDFPYTATNLTEAQGSAFKLKLEKSLLAMGHRITGMQFLTLSQQSVIDDGFSWHAGDGRDTQGQPRLLHTRCIRQYTGGAVR
jgi:hypothetical protein